MSNLIPAVQASWRDWSGVLANVVGDLRNSGPLPHFIWGSLAFLIYEVSVGSLMNYLGTFRHPAMLFIEFFVFGVVSLCLFLYSRACALEAEEAVRPRDESLEHRQREMAQLERLLSHRIGTFSECIQQSLAAIMFFVRAQLVRAADSQMERDLREVMERIDQIQLLLDELQQSVSSGALLDASKGQGEGKVLAATLSSAFPAGEPGWQREFKPVNSTFSLRRSARKVVILPITVSYSNEETQMNFDTYTVNVCEDGACIVFSEQNLDDKALIGIQMPREFQTQARIRWVQPSRENAFRLAGVQFIDRQIEVKSL